MPKVTRYIHTVAEPGVRMELSYDEADMLALQLAQSGVEPPETQSGVEPPGTLGEIYFALCEVLDEIDNEKAVPF